MGIFDRLHAKLEIFRLEQRYTRHRHRRSTFVSNAIYVDGEYIYQTPNNTGSSHASHESAHSGSGSVSPNAYGSSASSSYGSHQNTSSSAPDAAATAAATKQRKKMHRFSSMPGFGSSSVSNNRDVVAPRPDWRSQRASFDGSR